jgi:hypothetical protein
MFTPTMPEARRAELLANWASAVARA